ncbi:MAG: helix-turn-helix domain-containing protein [Candidatus Caldarchaeum sp.]
MRVGRLLSTQEIAEVLGMGRVTVVGMIRRGELKAVKVGKRYRVFVHELEEFLRRNEVGGENEGTGEGGGEGR